MHRPTACSASFVAAIIGASLLAAPAPARLPDAHAAFGVCAGNASDPAFQACVKRLKQGQSTPGATNQTPHHGSTKSKKCSKKGFKRNGSGKCIRINVAH